jgi:hypothetical protein
MRLMRHLTAKRSRFPASQKEKRITTDKSPRLRPIAAKSSGQVETNRSGHCHRTAIRQCGATSCGRRGQGSDWIFNGSRHHGNFQRSMALRATSVTADVPIISSDP